MKSLIVVEMGRTNRTVNTAPPRLAIVAIAFGFLLGFYLPEFIGVTVQIKLQAFPVLLNRYWNNAPNDTKDREFLYVGVVAAEHLLPTRAHAVHSTWGAHASKLTFFSMLSPGNDYPEKAGLDVVALPGVDDTYPPQKKVFMMLKHMHDNFIDDYDWFMRADDDVYLRVDKLMKFLSRFNASEGLYIGQPGMGKKEDLARIKLKEDEHYCMGGPGIIYSRGALKRLVPHIEDCMKNVVVSYNEDVEVGRCMIRRAKIQCTWSFEMRDLFFADYSHGKMFAGPQLYSDKRLKNVITVHSFKKPDAMFHIHKFFTEMQYNETIQELAGLKKKKNRVSQLMSPDMMLSVVGRAIRKDDATIKVNAPYKPSNGRDVVVYKSMSQKGVYELSSTLPTRPALGGDIQTVQAIAQNAVALLKKQTRVQHKVMDIASAYYRVDMSRGVDYTIFAVLYNQQTRTNSTYRLEYVKPFIDPILVNVAKLDYHTKPFRINVLLFLDACQPVSQTYSKFAGHYRRLYPSLTDHIHLSFVLYSGSDCEEDRRTQMAEDITEMQLLYVSPKLLTMDQGSLFSTVFGVTSLTVEHDITNDTESYFLPDDLLVIMHPQFSFNKAFIDNCLLQTRKSHSAYFPVPVESKDSNNVLHNNYDVFSIFYSDLERTKSITDMYPIASQQSDSFQLYNAIVASGLPSIRTIDPNLLAND